MTLPELPIDVWGIVLRLATCVPRRILDPDYAVEFCPSITRARRRLLKTSLFTKKHVVRVCKQWNNLATPYLYESIIINRSRTIISLREALQGLRGRPRPNTNAGHPLGWWTNRFDIAMHDLEGDVYDELVFLAEIIRCFTFCVTAKRYEGVILPPYFLPNLSKSSAANLQAIIWFNDAIAPDVNDWYTFLRRGIHTIRTVYCPAVGFPHDVLPALPAMQTFYIPQAWFEIQDSNPIPLSLRHAIFHVQDPHTDRVHAGWQLILRTCGQSLAVVQVYIRPGAEIHQVLETISQTCPNLKRLDISVPSWDDLNFGLSVPDIVWFGIHCLQVQVPRRDVRRLFNSLTSKLKFGAALKGIQFLCKGTVMDLCMNHRRVLLMGIRQLKSRGLEVMDHEGQVLNIE